VIEPFVIATEALRKSYAGVDALRGLDLHVPAGSICGFLGRNGAGKTTAIKTLLGMTHPTGGAARVFGLDATAPQSSLAIRRRTGFVSEEKELYGYLTVGEMVRFTASFFPHWRRDLEQRYLQRFELPPERRVKQLSRGMRTKLALLLALCRGAELLILDEPTSGLDPALAEEVLQALVAQVAQEESTVFFSSHQIAEVDQIADRVAIVHRGRTVVESGLDDLRERYCRVQLVFANGAPPVELRAPGVERVQRNGRVLTVLASRGADAIVEEARAFNPTSVDVMPVTLKEIFLECAAVEDEHALA
jgi:ABC-type multidrug transport system ATPase subunit